MGWDVFISHASEDKAAVARPMENLLVGLGFAVWLDQNELRLGDSLREKLDAGLAQSRYGVVILSQAFFSKRWPVRELNGLLAREADLSKVILPVWHGIDQSYIARFSPILADRIGISTSKGIQAVVDEIVRAIGRIVVSYNRSFSFPHDDIVTCATFAPNGRWLVAGSEVGTLKLLDTIDSTIKTLPEVLPGGNGVQSVDFSKDSSLLVAGSYMGEVALWSLPDLEPVLTPRRIHSTTIEWVGVSVDKKQLLAADAFSLKSINYEKGKEVATVQSFYSAYRVLGKDLVLLGLGRWKPTEDGTRCTIALKDGYTVIEGQSIGEAGDIEIRHFDDLGILFRITVLPPLEVKAIEINERKGEIVALTEDNVAHWINWSTGEQSHSISLEDTTLFERLKKPNWAHGKGCALSSFYVMNYAPMLFYHGDGNALFFDYERRTGWQ